MRDQITITGDVKCDGEECTETATGAKVTLNWKIVELPTDWGQYRKRIYCPNCLDKVTSPPEE